MDEYVDDDDVGYCRHDIPGQDAFIAREIDMSDDDGTGRGNMLYHKALYEMQVLSLIKQALPECIGLQALDSSGIASPPARAGTRQYNEGSTWDGFRTWRVSRSHLTPSGFPGGVLCAMSGYFQG